MGPGHHDHVAAHRRYDRPRSRERCVLDAPYALTDAGVGELGAMQESQGLARADVHAGIPAVNCPAKPRTTDPSPKRQRGVEHGSLALPARREWRVNVHGRLDRVFNLSMRGHSPCCIDSQHYFARLVSLRLGLRRRVPCRCARKPVCRQRLGGTRKPRRDARATGPAWAR